VLEAGAATSGAATSAETIILEAPGEVPLVRASLVSEVATAGPFSRKLRIFGALEPLNRPTELPFAPHLQPLLTQLQMWVSQAKGAITASALGCRMRTLLMPHPDRQESPAKSQAQPVTVSQTQLRVQEGLEPEGDLQRQTEDVPQENPGLAREVLKPIQAWDEDDMPVGWQNYWAGCIRGSDIVTQ